MRPFIKPETYQDLIQVIPKMPTLRLLELIAFMRLELQLRNKKNEEDKTKN
jgi:hypothetical protein